MKVPQVPVKTSEPLQFQEKTCASLLLIIQEHYSNLFGETYSHIKRDVFQVSIKKVPNTTVLNMIESKCPQQARMAKLTIHSQCPYCNQALEDCCYIITYEKTEYLLRSHFTYSGNSAISR